MENSSIQDKCSITSLLSDGSKRRDPEQLLQDIESIKLSLNQMLDLLRTTPDFHSEDLNDELSIIMERLIDVQSQQTDLLEEHRDYFIDVDAQARKLLLLVKEAKFLNDETNRFLRHLSSTSDSDSMLFKIVTQDMMNKNGSFIGKRKRLERSKVAVLEQWYSKNCDRPYLSDSMLLSLMGETGLSKIQIKNWLSNKRRKERGGLVSNELCDLLDESSP
ncbi:homeobox domain-containing protein CYBJADRAFT_201347 [Cyberlindnera jadinii NRRL Y-1542]|uniref:Homeobox domain-containing protein n=2 Tax=Cyberlindnera jadinii (strain ATCC 18201 / CBS 1600 / BCRC 20928 / JCM 3617 / NBRC 0987 / NRRL Y-1542) TaxID=983966 RepID=A0A1E4S5A0_CYBJN|nr:hypothetical protein CYBJADRAFT_201347 [Cyberlindnera jadinii NRRL Y-1542]ODV74572.1 hypothetical protein CYBJADRAFT_201347 [Cyberlindnera jadinii NRRL Y-1542]